MPALLLLSDGAIPPLTLQRPLNMLGLRPPMNAAVLQLGRHLGRDVSQVQGRRYEYFEVILQAAGVLCIGAAALNLGRGYLVPSRYGPRF
jgi:hypothetical protein